MSEYEELMNQPITIKGKKIVVERCDHTPDMFGLTEEDIQKAYKDFPTSVDYKTFKDFMINAREFWQKVEHHEYCHDETIADKCHDE